MMDSYQEYIHKSRYARWREEDNRRETWQETVQRYVDFFKERGQIDDKESKMLYDAIYNLDVMPSMRCLMTAGKALERDNMAGFNCSYIAIDHIRAFDEILYVLMCGTGVGFSVERQSVNKLPEVAEEFQETDTTVVVKDSKIGWAKAYRELVSLLYSGQIPSWDLSRLRQKGERLKTFGGRSSGPDPLNALFHFTVSTFRQASGRKLTSIECHDLVCKIAEIVVVGGVRRSALISLSNLSDDRMRHAKSGNWWENNTQRALANNSAVYTERPEFETFLEEWLSLYKSKAGERGIFSRIASKNQASLNGRRDIDHDFGTNPCSEIILRSVTFQR
jgi:ribonucleoside-triphosphate reductase